MPFTRADIGIVKNVDLGNHETVSIRSPQYILDHIFPKHASGSMEYVLEFITSDSKSSQRSQPLNPGSWVPEPRIPGSQDPVFLNPGVTNPGSWDPGILEDPGILG